MHGITSLAYWALGICSVGCAMSAFADSAAARCDIYAAGSDKASASVDCTFSQRQGRITLVTDAATYDLTPVGDAPGNYRDAVGRPAYRQSGLGDQGLIFRFEDQSVFVYWKRATDASSGDGNNPTAPFTTDDYDATTILRCRASGASEFGDCPAGILRMEDGQASIVVQNPAGEQFTINFMRDYVNATNREVEARLSGDTWTVKVSDGEVYEVPLAAIEGG